jgi:Protein of unknown function (DUF3108)
MKAVAIGVIAMLSTMRPLAAAEAPLVPFVAEYDVRYGNMGVGSSRTELAATDAPGRWRMVTSSTASGFARLIAGGTLLQSSTFTIDAGGIRPQSYSFDDGTRRTGRDVSLEFDWAAGRVRGTAEDEPVDLAGVEGLQDAASMQALVLARLRAGDEPGMIAMIEKDRIKHYRYTLLKRESLSTAIGVLDTVAYQAARDGSDRETVSWHAPSLGYVVVKAEQHVDGKRGFQTLIRRFQPGEQKSPP